MSEVSRVDKSLFYLKNNRYTAPIITGGIILSAIILFGKNISDAFFKNSDLENKIQVLNNNIDSIKLSLKKYDFKVINNQVVPTENNILYQKYMTSINNGHVGDIFNKSTTINQTNSEKNETLLQRPQLSENLHNVEIENLRNPEIINTGDAQSVVFSLNTKTKEEASNVTGLFNAVYKRNGVLEVSGNYANPNSTVITNYPSDFTYLFESSTNADTIYIFLKLTHTNSIGQQQNPFQVLYRKTKSKNSLIRIFTGTREYKDVIEKVFQSSF